jgi:signal transduction histidine kinase
MRRPPHQHLENMNPVGTLSPQQLEQAFQVFNLASSDLCLAYEDLRQQSLVLTRELALANGELRRQFAEKEALRESVQRRERLAAMGEIAARLAHQLRTPLATALLYAAQLGETGLPAAERARFAGKTVDRLRDLERLIEAAELDFGAAPAPQAPQPPQQQRADTAAPGAAMDMKSLERAHIMETLLAVNGSRKLAVERLGISERALRYKLQQYRLQGGTA